MLVTGEQTGEVTGPGPGHLLPLLHRERVRPDHRYPPPAIEDLLGRSQVTLGASADKSLGELSLEPRALARGHLRERRTDRRSGTLDPCCCCGHTTEYPPTPPWLAAGSPTGVARTSRPRTLQQRFASGSWCGTASSRRGSRGGGEEAAHLRRGAHDTEVRFRGMSGNCI